MKIKGKNLSIICILLICLVFACTIGATFAALSVKFVMGSNPKSTQAYMAKQGYSVVNDTITNPISYGYGDKNFEVALQYAYSYNFDVRIKYSLTWSNCVGSSRDIVDLNYANRDNYITDNEYIYYADTITAGSGTLKIFTGVSFATLTDENYIGGYLTINIDEVKIYKQVSEYTTSHPLYVNSEAGEGWLNVKSNSITSGAYVIVYNKHYNEASGIDYPGSATAYSKQYNFGDSQTSVRSATWLGGNKFNGGLEMYIITGSTPVKIKASTVGTWQLKQTGSSQTVFENNVKLNYTENWATTGDDAIDETGNASTIFKEHYYTYTIPANTHMLIKVLDSVEITCEEHDTTANNRYSNYRLITHLRINDKYLDNSASGVEGAMVENAQLDGSLTVYAQAISKPQIAINNNTTYQNALYQVNYGAVAQTYRTNISLTNNTRTAVNVSLSYSLRYFISNGITTSVVAGGSTGFWGSSYYSEFEDLDSTYFTVNEVTTLIPAYSSVLVVDQFSVSSTVADYIFDKYHGYYDVWLELIPTVTGVSTSASENVQLEATSKAGQIVLSLKNKSNNSITNVGVKDVVLELLTPTFTPISSRPANWVSNSWQYYYKDTDNNYKPYPSNRIFDASNCYQLSYTTNQTVSLNSASVKNGFSYSGGTFSSSNTLRPNEQIVVATIYCSVDYMLLVRYTSVGSTNDTPQIDAINEGSNNAYIYNPTDKSYYVRFVGNLKTNLPYIKQINGYNYYMGVVRAGQLVNIPLNNSTNFKFEFIQIEADGVFNKNTISSWGDDAVNAFEQYFSIK